jgi:hypothetical protein
MPEYTSSRTGVIPENDYPFVVDDAVEKESRRGTPMIEVQLEIDYNGTKVRVFDHLVFTQYAFWKIDQFREATGEQLVENQKVILEAEDCIGRTGHCHLIIDTYEGKTRNKVDAYLPPPVIPSAPPKAGKTGDAKKTGTGATVSLNELGEPDDLRF